MAATICRNALSVNVIGMLILSCLVTILPAQNIWLEKAETPSVGLEILKPDFDGDANLDFLSTATFLSGNFPISSGTNLQVDLPIAHFGFRGRTETLIANPYIGLATKRNTSGVRTEVGVRLPIADDNKGSAVLIGAWGDYDRVEAFVPDLAAAIFRADFRRISASNMITRIYGGPTVWLATKNNGPADDLEVLLDYALQIGYQSEANKLLVGLSGRALITEANLSFSERTVHQLGATFSCRASNWWPGVHIKVPLDNDLSDIIDFVVGVNLNIDLQH